MGFKKRVAGLLVGLCGFLGATPAVRAADNLTLSGAVKRVWQYSAVNATGQTFLEIEGGTCTPAGSSMKLFVIRANDPKQDLLSSVAMAAYLSGRNVYVSYDPTPNSCAIVSIRLE